MGDGFRADQQSGIWTLAVHGGAGVSPGEDHSESEAHMKHLLQAGASMLGAGASAVETVCEMVRELEECGLYVAGRGANPSADGRWELDAAIMDGETRRAGAVGALEGVRHPILAARAVMDHSPHVMLGGRGAFDFARKFKLKRVKNPDKYYTRVPSSLGPDRVLAHGTVGAVALDADGLLAAASSSSGASGKTTGRIGESAVIGAGVWADSRVAVSCAGVGEYFQRVAAASDVSARVRYGRESLETAAREVIDEVSYLGGEGGMIAIDCLGRIAMPFNGRGLKRGFVTAAGALDVRTL